MRFLIGRYVFLFSKSNAGELHVISLTERPAANSRGCLVSSYRHTTYNRALTTSWVVHGELTHKTKYSNFPLHLTLPKYKACTLKHTSIAMFTYFPSCKDDEGNSALSFCPLEHLWPCHATTCRNEWQQAEDQGQPNPIFRGWTAKSVLWDITKGTSSGMWQPSSC